MISGNALSATAVLVVACSCSIALATPIATLASIGAAAKQGLVVKGGKYLELLANAKVVLIDKTGTVTFGKPRITKVIPVNGVNEEEIITLAASAERFSEHPLAAAIKEMARDKHLPFEPIDSFEALPGMGVHARIKGHLIRVGNDRHRFITANEQMMSFRLTNGTKIFVEKMMSSSVP